MKSKSVESEADLYVDGQLVSTGESVLYLSEGNGVFWPHDGKLLDAPYREASLNVAGMPDAVRIKDVHQCSAIALGVSAHWLSVASFLLGSVLILTDRFLALSFTAAKLRQK